jgi:hypothetical protein
LNFAYINYVHNKTKTNTVMSTENKTMESNVNQVEIDLDEMFNGAPGAQAITLPSAEPPKKSIFSKNDSSVDMSFTEPNSDGSDDSDDDNGLPGNSGSPEGSAQKKQEVNALLDSFVDGDEEKVETRGRKPINGISDVFHKLIKDEKLVPFEDDKPFEEYTLKDWEELIEANLEEKANQARKETPKQFFESLPQELQIAARYVADGGADLKGLFSTLAAVEETRELNPKDQRDQEYIIREYLGATGFGTADEIDEEISVWRDLGKLEQQAMKFKPKLDRMQEEVVMHKLQEQELRKRQQQQASHQYMENVYNTLKEGALGELKIDRKTQAMLYNGLVQPNYPSVTGKNTNLLGHLLEKYQFVEPNYTLISEALWLLSDPEGYKSKIMEKGAVKSTEETVRKLKTAQANLNSTSNFTEEEEDTKRQAPGKKLPRARNIFSRF